MKKGIKIFFKQDKKEYAERLNYFMVPRVIVKHFEEIPRDQGKLDIESKVDSKERDLIEEIQINKDNNVIEG